MNELLLASLIWALSFGLIKHHLQGINPFWIGTLRLLLSFAVFLPWLRVGGVKRGQTQAPRTLAAWMGIGAIQYGFMYLLYLSSFRFLKAHEVALLTLTTPIFVVLAGAAIERQWDLRHIGASVLAVGTSVFAVLDPSMSFHGLASSAGGVLLVSGANLLFATGQMLTRRYRFTETRQELNSMAWMYLGGCLVTTFALSATLGTDALNQLKHIAWSQSLIIVHLGVIASGFGFFLWARGVRKASVGLVAVLNNLKVPLGVGASALIFGEAVAWERILPAMAAFWLIGMWAKAPANIVPPLVTSERV